MTNLPVIKLDKGIHAMHLFYRVDRQLWAGLTAGESEKSRQRLEELCAANKNPSHPRLTTYANVGGKADLVFFLLAAELAELSRMHRDLEACFPDHALSRVFSYLSVTELTERMRQYEHYRLYPELPDWEIMAFYPMSKRRAGADNWYMLDFA